MASDSGPAKLPPPAEDPQALLEARYRALEEQLAQTRLSEELTALRSAYQFAAERHRQQRRDSGEPYMVHPLGVTQILADMNMDMVCLQTGLLHDVLEDTGTSLEELRSRFGEEVARCVDGVTKLSKLNFYDPETRQAESFRKMLLAMVNDVRVIIVKLADRLHNMRTLASLPPERQQRIARETVEIYAPIAHRLGMGKIRGELEDLAFSYLEPQAAAELGQFLESRRSEFEQFLAEIKATIERKLAAEGIPARVEGRVKRAYSIFQKIRRQRIPIEQVYDLLAVRIITDSVINCYAALGVIHNEWHPVPGRIKDFIAIKRPNFYQSLHTSVIGPGGRAFEVQIRTEQMHRIAEEGIAAHWKYKEGHKGPAEDVQRIAWLRQLVEWQQEMRDPGDFMSTLKVDLYPEEVYCFTPRGKVIALPRGATPIDFAYAIHTDVGHTCVGAKVNGRIVSLRYNLRNGDVVEILTQPGHLPSKDWLALVKTSRARNKIKQVINMTERAKAVDLGQKLLEKEARRLGVSLSKFPKSDWDRVANEYGCSKIEDLHAALGFGKFSARQVLLKLVPQPPEAAAEQTAPVPAPAKRATGDLVVKVKGVDDLLVYRAKCCNPIRGEAIVGYVTRGKGVAVHSTNCPNVQNLLYEADRKIDVEWGRAGDESFPVKMIIHTDDRPGMLHQLTSILSGEQSNIRSLEARAIHDRNGDGAVVDMTVDIKDKKQLERIVAAMRRLSGVRDVERV
ncbi:MAG: bifunctional (p)ppGpp synthetase/guanosine-3',5'-bis(diphosphate) 3'-pyrophosphohydrolase [Bryobacterales bacterium]|nr:bifunctional (p)ppGpp synthetase/guanosine-3',5'-bis(diphosphate) 3'-pyrophosphohydrolase [Bryobacteraceae bacterium]MDW8353274.1 bifunctional (p)ppGpp synthetase/guanosine-3',5'-bis(diphosphate) 3'-pyrophosphohydrolase [Bryobacterales bacterium]